MSCYHRRQRWLTFRFHPRLRLRRFTMLRPNHLPTMCPRRNRVSSLKGPVPDQARTMTEPIVSRPIATPSGPVVPTSATRTETPANGLCASPTATTPAICACGKIWDIDFLKADTAHPQLGGLFPSLKFALPTTGVRLNRRKSGTANTPDPNRRESADTHQHVLLLCRTHLDGSIFLKSLSAIQGAIRDNVARMEQAVGRAG